MKNLNLVFYLLLFSLFACQGENANKAAKNDLATDLVDHACRQLTQTNGEINDYLEIINQSIKPGNLFAAAYQKEILANKKVSKITEKFDAYVKFVMRRDCKAYRQKWNALDKSYEGKPILRTAYQNNRNILFDLFNNDATNNLSDYFDITDDAKLKGHLEQIVQGFSAEKIGSLVHTTELQGERIVFYNTFLDYVTGEENLRLVLIFNSTGEKITGYAFIHDEVEIIED